MKGSAEDTQVMFISKYLVSDKNQILNNSDWGNISVKDMDAKRDDSGEPRSKIRLLILSD